MHRRVCKQGISLKLNSNSKTIRLDELRRERENSIRTSYLELFYYTRTNRVGDYFTYIDI